MQSLTAACLAGGSGIVVSHRAAAAFWRFPGFNPGIVEISAPNGQRPRLHGVIPHEMALPVPDVERRGIIRITSPTRTLLDIAGVVDEERFEIAMDYGLAKGMTSLPRLEWRLDALGRRPGAALVRELIAVRRITSIPQSPLETKALRRIRKAGLDLPVCQYPVRDQGRVVAVVDFAYPDRMLAIEADGYEFHSGRVSFEYDRQRLNALTSLGWTVVFLTDRHLDKGITRLKSLLTNHEESKN